MRIDVDDEDYEGTDGIDFRLLETDDEGMPDAFDTGPIPGIANAGRPVDAAMLESLLSSIGLVTVALAVFEVGRFLLEEELLRDRELRTIADARLSLTKFMSITVIVLTIEGLVLLFEIKRKEVADLVYPTGLLVVAVLTLVGLGVFRKLTDAFATGPEHAEEEEISERTSVEA